MNLIKRILSVIFAISLIIICFFSAMDILLYGCKGFIPGEYRKLGVAEATGVSQDDLDEVSVQMMQYLKGNRELLSDIKTTVNGVPDTAFFNERECAHMKDVRALFLGGMALRRWCIVICVVILAFILIVDRKNAIEILSRGMITGTVVFLLAVGAIGIFAATNFDAFWTVFHHLFFEGDTWLFDPATSRMINMLPEQFFSDTVKYIIIIFAAMMAVLLGLAAAGLKRKKN